MSRLVLVGPKLRLFLEAAYRFWRTWREWRKWPYRRVAWWGLWSAVLATALGLVPFLRAAWGEVTIGWIWVPWLLSAAAQFVAGRRLRAAGKINRKRREVQRPPPKGWGAVAVGKSLTLVWYAGVAMVTARVVAVFVGEVGSALDLMEAAMVTVSVLAGVAAGRGLSTVLALAGATVTAGLIGLSLTVTRAWKAEGREKDVLERQSELYVFGLFLAVTMFTLSFFVAAVPDEDPAWRGVFGLPLVVTAAVGVVYLVIAGRALRLLGSGEGDSDGDDRPTVPNCSSSSGVPEAVDDC